MALPKFLNDKQSTRERSKKQETRIAKSLQGRVTINSGATFGENDIITDFMEVEAKTTSHKSFVLKISDWEKANKKTKSGRIPTMVIDFENTKHSLAVITYEDLLFLINQANT